MKCIVHLLPRVVFAFCPCLYIVRMSHMSLEVWSHSPSLRPTHGPKALANLANCTSGGGRKEIKSKHTGYPIWINWMLPKPAQRPLQKDGFLVRQQGCHGSTSIASNPELCICTWYFEYIISPKHSPKHWQVTVNSHWCGSNYSTETKRKNLCDPHPQVQTQKNTPGMTEQL